jgi:hypothetical protein
VALAAWRALQGGHRGGPELALADACLLCLDAKLQGIAAAQDASQVSVEPEAKPKVLLQYVWLRHGIVGGLAEEGTCLPCTSERQTPGSALRTQPAPGTKAACAADLQWAGSPCSPCTKSNLRQGTEKVSNAVVPHLTRRAARCWRCWMQRKQQAGTTAPRRPAASTSQPPGSRACCKTASDSLLFIVLLPLAL